MKRSKSETKRRGALVKVKAKTAYILNTQEAADYIGISASLLQQSRISLSKKSRVTRMTSPKYVKLGRLVRYSIYDLDRWIQERRKKA